MSDYTPGPWTIHEYGDEDCPALVIHKDTESRVCFMATPGSHGDPAKIEADALLIAAAPELLAAAELAADALLNADPGNPKDETGWAHDESCDAWVKLHAAIAKATGKSAAPIAGQQER